MKTASLIIVFSCLAILTCAFFMAEEGSADHGWRAETDAPDCELIDDMVECHALMHAMTLDWVDDHGSTEGLNEDEAYSEVAEEMHRLFGESDASYVEFFK